MTSHIKVQKVCRHCGKDFLARTTVTKFCGHKCASANYKVRARQGKIIEAENETEIIKRRPLEEIQAKEFLCVEEVSKLLGISQRTIFRLLKSGKIPSAKIGRRTIIKRNSLEQLFE